jgi:transposase
MRHLIDNYLKISNVRKIFMAFVRKVKVKNDKGGYDEYVRIVESYREGGKVKQRIISHLGNVKTLKKDIHRIVNGLLRAVDEHGLVDPATGEKCKAKEYGSKYVVEHLWEELEFSNIYKPVDIRGGKEAVPYEKYIRMMVVNKLSDPESKLGIFRWLTKVWWPDSGFPEELHNESLRPEEQKELAQKEVMKLYRAMDEMIEKKEELERHIYHKLRDLFSIKVDIIFYDLTSSYFEGRGPEGLATLGYSRDNEPGKTQIVVGVIMCNGFPIGHEVFEGNRVDKKTVKEILNKIKGQYIIHRCIFVGDRGLISKENLNELEEGKEFDSILALKKRRNNEVKGILMGEHPLIFHREKEDMEWVEVAGEDNVRYVVVRNPEIAEEQKGLREGHIKGLDEQLRSLQEKVNRQKRISIKNTTEKVAEILRHHHGRRYFAYSFDKKDKKFKYWIKGESLRLEEALDGIYILRTKEPNLSSLEIIKNYKDLMEVERGFRVMKDVLDLRPFRHRKDIRVRAHVLICFIALLFSKIMERYLKMKKIDLSAPMAWESLKNMQITEIEFHGDKYQYLTELTYYQKIILKALKIKLPSRFTIADKKQV